MCGLARPQKVREGGRCVGVNLELVAVADYCRSSRIHLPIRLPLVGGSRSDDLCFLGRIYLRLILVQRRTGHFSLEGGTGYLHGKNKGKKMLEFCCAIGKIPS